MRARHANVYPFWTARRQQRAAQILLVAAGVALAVLVTLYGLATVLVGGFLAAAQVIG